MCIRCGACREVGDRVGASAGSFAEVFEADVSADTEGPGHHRSSFPTLQVGHDPDERFLGEVVGVGGAGEVCAEPPHVGLDGADEPIECDSVASGGRDSSANDVSTKEPRDAESRTSLASSIDRAYNSTRRWMTT